MEVNIEIVHFCPLDKVCEEIKDNKLYRCRWWNHLAGVHPQTGEPIDEWDCAISWQPVLSCEMARTNRGQTAAIESFRNESVKRQDALLGLAAQSKKLKISSPDYNNSGSDMRPSSNQAWRSKNEQDD